MEDAIAPRKPIEFRYARWLFLRLLGIIYFIAFASLGVQILPLLGSEGLLPAAEVLEKPANLSTFEFWRLEPTLFHLGASDGALQAGIWVGAFLSVLLLLDLAPAVCAILLWILYLSYVSVARDFLSFQWDNLLLEAGALAIFLAPWTFRPRRPGSACALGNPPSHVMIFLFQFLIFRLNFESGFSKFVSGDMTWRNLTAMDYYYETAPLPTLFGWYMHHMPHWFHAGEVIVTFAIELGLSLFVFGPRVLRLIAFFPLFGLQLFIGSTANYGFFNYLSAALLVFLIDDTIFKRVFAQAGRIRKAKQDATGEADACEGHAPPKPRWRIAFDLAKLSSSIVLSVFYVLVAYVGFARAFLPDAIPSKAGKILALEQWLQPFRAINRYHLFATMTTERYEIEIQGSDDRIDWKTYEFRHKAGDPKRAPDFVAPHQPRLDFQNWFLLIRRGEIEQFENNVHDSRYFTFLVRNEPFFANLLIGLMRNSDSAKWFFAKVPYPNRAPAFFRVLVYRYTMTSFAERRETGAYWNRKLVAEWGPFASGRNR